MQVREVESLIFAVSEGCRRQAIAVRGIATSCHIPSGPVPPSRLTYSFGLTPAWLEGEQPYGEEISLMKSTVTVCN